MLLMFAMLPALAVRTTAVAPGNTDGETANQRLSDWAVTGPMGGDVRSLVIDPQDPQRLYFGTIDGQIYTSRDGGELWARLNGFSRPGLLIDNIIVDPRDSKTIYVAAHRHKSPAGSSRPRTAAQHGASRSS